MSAEALKSGAVVFCAQPARLAAFYRAVAGLQPTHEEPALVVLESATVHLVLHAFGGKPPESPAPGLPAAPPEPRRDACIKLSFPVADLAVARERAASLGGRLAPASEEWSARGFRASEGVDPEGNVFQVRTARDDGAAAVAVARTLSTARAPMSPIDVARGLDELWSPRVIAELDDYYVKVAKVQGDLDWHDHAGEDELFFVLAGRFRLEFEDGAVDLGPGELHVVPKGVRHHPVAVAECLLMLVERKSTRHTGDVVGERTRSLAEQLRPVGSSSGNA